MLGVIGGSGVYDPNLLVDLKESQVDTPFGSVSLSVGRFADLEVAFLQRHGSGHVVPPHMINYRANVWALWQIGVDRIISTSAVGSLNRDMPPGSLCLVDQFIDFTKNRVSTFFSGGEFGLAHVDFTEPYCTYLRSILASVLAQEGVPHATGGCYICLDGPRYETPAEIRAFRGMGADVVGMTNVPEVVLARELGLCYQTVCMVTNWAAGMAPERLSHQEVLDVMAKNGASLKSLLRGAMEQLLPQTAHRTMECSCGSPLESVGQHKRGSLR